jgi:hypothetical protein
MNQSPFRRYVVESSRYVAQVPGHAEMVEEAHSADQTATAELATQIEETHGLHVVTGTLGWHGPTYAAVMPRETRDERLASRQTGPAVSAKLTWAEVCYLPGYSQGQFWHHESLEQALANFFAAQLADTPLPE